MQESYAEMKKQPLINTNNNLNKDLDAVLVKK